MPRPHSSPICVLALCACCAQESPPVASTEVALQATAVASRTGEIAPGPADEVVLGVGFEGASDENGAPAPWDLGVKEGEARVQVGQHDGRTILELDCESSSFSLDRDLEAEIEPCERMVLRWSWRADRLPERGDLRDEDLDDQGAQLMVGFGKRRVINYVWDANAPVGTRRDDTYALFYQVRTLVVCSGTGRLGEWITVERDLLEDYRELFGGEPPAVGGLRLQSNTQYTGGRAQVAFGPIEFVRTAGEQGSPASARDG